MFTSYPIIKGRADRASKPKDEESSFVGGVIRDSGARLRTVALDETDWSAGVPAPDPDPAPPTLDPAAMRATWEAEWQARADDEREAAVAAAREAAYAEGRAAALAEVEAARVAERSAFEADAARLHTLWAEHLDAAEPLLVALAVDVAEAALGTPLTTEAQEAAHAALTSAIEHLAGQPPLVVSLHPVEHLRLCEAGMVDALSAAHPGLRWAPDDALAEGDWSLDASGAAVRHVRAEVLTELRQRLGLPSLSSEEPPTDEPLP